MKKFLLLTFLFCGSLTAGDFDEFEQFIIDAQKEWQVPGVSVAIVKDDKIVYAKGFGFADIAQNRKIDADTLFRLASVSKTFAGVGMAAAVDQKLIEWDQPVVEKLPFFALKDMYATRNTSARDLLAHRTGLPAFSGDLLFRLGLSSSDLLHRIRFMEPETSFRAKALYSNIGFYLAGEVLAQLQGTGYEDAIRKTIYIPLEMTRSGFREKLQDPNAANTYALVNGKIEPIPGDPIEPQTASSGGAVSTAADLARFMVMLLNDGAYKGKEILSNESVKELFRPSMVGEIGFSESPPIYEDSSFSFGMGFDNYQYEGEFIVEKGGALQGTRTVITLIPGKKAGIAVLCNLNLTLLPEVIRARFLELEVKPSTRDMRAEFQEQKEQLSRLIKPSETLKNVLPMALPLEKYAGRYSNELYGVFDIQKQGDSLVLFAGPAKYEGNLTHYSYNTFVLTWPSAITGHEEFTFIFGPEGKPTAIQTDSYGLFKVLSEN